MTLKIRIDNWSELEAWQVEVWFKYHGAESSPPLFSGLYRDGVAETVPFMPILQYFDTLILHRQSASRVHWETREARWESKAKTGKTNNSLLLRTDGRTFKTPSEDLKAIF